MMSRLSDGIDADCQNWYAVHSNIERSIINLVLSPQGTVTLYLLGQPVLVTGGADGGAAEPARGGHAGSRP